MIGHTPAVPAPGASTGLHAQVASAIEAFDTVKEHYGDAKIVLVGHSIGSWIALQVLKARPEAVAAIFLLLPTISHIGSTPNGRKLSVCITLLLVITSV